MGAPGLSFQEGFPFEVCGEGVGCGLFGRSGPQGTDLERTRAPPDPTFQPFDPFLIENEARLIAMLANECTLHRAYDVDTGGESEGKGEVRPIQPRPLDEDSK